MRAPASGAAWRWSVVALLVAVLAALPSVVGARSAADRDVSAADLRRAVLGSADLGFSGYAQSAGGLSLPVSDQLTSVADLFSERTTMRVWWRSPADHRIDVLSPAGETGVHRDDTGTWTWEYERATAVRTAPSPLSLPAPPDLLPSSLGRRLLSEATDAELSRIGAERIAGRTALGIRLVPDDAASSVRRVDVWVDGDSGLPLSVQVVAEGAARPALDTRYLDLDLRVPEAAVTAFRPPPGATVRNGREAEVILDAGRRLRPVPLPGGLAGLGRRTLAGAPPGIGLFGRGVTLLAVAPVPPRLAGALRDALGRSPGAVADDLGIRVAAGPLGLMLVEPPGRAPYVLTGTVTVTALATAAGELAALDGRR